MTTDQGANTLMREVELARLKLAKLREAVIFNGASSPENNIFTNSS